jgi:hypothetical protein
MNRTPKKQYANTTGAAPADIGFLLDELRLGGVVTYADLAASLNRQGIRPARGRWTAHAIQLAMRRQRYAHPEAGNDRSGAQRARLFDARLWPPVDSTLSLARPRWRVLYKPAPPSEANASLTGKEPRILSGDC